MRFIAYDAAATVPRTTLPVDDVVSRMTQALRVGGAAWNPYRLIARPRSSDGPRRHPGVNQRHGCDKLPPMATINRRIAASIEGDFVVFIIGARFNRWWKLPRYLWFLSTMPKMLAEVAAASRERLSRMGAPGPHDECAVLAIV